jgi:hypothetical protein
MNGKVEYNLKQSVRLRKPKIACSPSSADYRLKINAVIYWTWVTH